MSEIAWYMDRNSVISTLEERRYYIEDKYGWEIPELVWDDFIQFVNYVEELYGSPSEIVDNIATNGDYEDIYDVINEYENDIIDLLNRCYDRERDSFNIYKKSREIENLTGAHRFPSEPFSIDNYYVIEKLFGETFYSLKFSNNIKAIFEIDNRDMVIRIKCIDKKDDEKFHKVIEKEFGYLMEKEVETYKHLGLLEIRKLENDENGWEYEIDFFSFPYMYFVRSIFI